MAYQKQTWRDYDDNKTEVVNMNQGAVVTPERLNHMENGIANSADKAEVTAQLQQTEQEFNAQLAQKVTKGNIVKSDFDTSSDSKKLGLLNLNEEVQQAMAGIAPVISSVANGSLVNEKYADGSVTLEKTSHSEQDISKLNWKLEAISTANGLTGASTKQLSSGFFRISKGTQFRRKTGANGYIHAYDKFYKHIGSYVASIHNIVPVDCYYGRISLFYDGSPEITDPTDLITYMDVFNFKFNDAVELYIDESVYALDKWVNGVVGASDGVYSPSYKNRVVSSFLRGQKGVSLETRLVGVSFYVALYDIHFKHIKSTSYATSAVINDDFYAMRIVLRFDDGRDITESNKKSIVDSLEYRNFTSLNNWTTNRQATANPLESKILFNFGDSIASSQTEGVLGYHNLIAEKNGMTLVNYARNGATITAVAGETNHLNTQINNAIASQVMPDYVLFDGLRNDYSLPDESIGSITAGYDETLDIETFCGAFEHYCKTMRENWLGAKIIYIRTHNTYVVGAKQITLGELALEICRKWAIPFVDIYSEGGLNTQFPAMRGLFTLSEADGTHPNQLGYEKFYVPPIEAKMKSV